MSMTYSVVASEDHGLHRRLDEYCCSGSRQRLGRSGRQHLRGRQRTSITASDDRLKSNAVSRCIIVIQGASRKIGSVEVDLDLT